MGKGGIFIYQSCSLGTDVMIPLRACHIIIMNLSYSDIQQHHHKHTMTSVEISA